MLEGSEEVVGVMDYHHWKLSPKLGSAAEVACHFAVSGDRLPNHTEGHRLNGREVSYVFYLTFIVRTMFTWRALVGN